MRLRFDGGGFLGSLVAMILGVRFKYVLEVQYMF